MIVVMKPGSSPRQVEHVVQLVREMGLKDHVIVGTERTVVAVIGDDRMKDRPALEASPGVQDRAFKPRTSPYAFQRMGKKGLELLTLAREETELGVVTEVMAVDQVQLVAKYADVMQVGARNMQNFNLLNAVGEQPRPVLLKRGLSATLEEFLLAAEYIMSRGNPHVMLCERGIRTYEDYCRNTLALAAVPALHRATHL